MLQKKKISLIALVTTFLLAALDQLTKWLAVIYVKPQGSISLIKFGETQWVNLTYCENTGMSFSLLEGKQLLLTILPIIMICVIEWYIFSGRVKGYAQLFSLAVVAGGGFGNLIDRIFLGYVVDFIDFKIINFAIFNFADICVVCGGIVFAILFILEDKMNEKKEKSAEMSKEQTDEQP